MTSLKKVARSLLLCLLLMSLMALPAHSKSSDISRELDNFLLNAGLSGKLYTLPNAPGLPNYDELEAIITGAFISYKKTIGVVPVYGNVLDVCEVFAHYHTVSFNEKTGLFTDEQIKEQKEAADKHLKSLGLDYVVNEAVSAALTYAGVPAEALTAADIAFAVAETIDPAELAVVNEYASRESRSDLDVISSLQKTSSGKTIESTYEIAKGLIDSYGSLPGGVVFENKARGLNDFSKVIYYPNGNFFLIDNQFVYFPPISSTHCSELIQALRSHDLLGVSLHGSYLTVYGGLAEESKIVRDMVVADHLMGHMCYNYRKDTFNNFKVKNELLLRNNNEDRLFVTFVYNEVDFSTKGNMLLLKHNNLDIVFYPSGEKTKSGGYLPDYDKIKTGFDPDKNVQRNANNLTSSIGEYLSEPALRNVFNYAEVVAFLRNFNAKNITLAE